MGPLIPIALAGAAVYGIKRFFDAKKPAQDIGRGKYDPSGGPLPGASAPGDPGYPANADPSYTSGGGGAPTQPMSLNQMGQTLQKLTAARIVSGKTVAQASPLTLGSFASRASTPLVDLTPAPAAPPAPTLSSRTLTGISSAVSPTTSTLLKPGGIVKTFSK